MSDKDKNEREIGGLGSNDAPPSPFVSKKMSGEMLNKLRPYSYAEQVAKPEIPTRGEKEEPTEELRPQRNLRSASVISQMRENARVIDNAQKGIAPDNRALVSTEPTEEETALQTEERDEKPRDDGYDIRTVFGIPEMEKPTEEVDVKEEETAEESDFSASKEFSKLKKEFFSCFPKIALCLVLAVATFLFENFELLGINNAVFIRINSDVRISALAGIQMTLFAVVIMFREMKYGFFSLIRFKAQPESFLPFLAIFLMFYQFISLFGGYNAFVPFNFVLFLVC
ncbi:MAG: hypothetical protein IIU77_06290, partial [Clostridia bacterium]|nr:hypothetical protein [Clostridia bacterium]